MKLLSNLLILVRCSKYDLRKMSFKNKIADSNSAFLTPVKLLYYRFFNKYYQVNDIISRSQITDDGSLKVTLKSGIILESPPSQIPAEINFTERYNYGTKSKMDKILDVNKYYFLYEILSELFIHSEYFSYFDINEGDTVIDAGANIGGFTVQAAKKVGPQGKVIAIEPDEQNRITLQRNLDNNNLKNVEIIPLALWSEKCTKEFHISNRPGEHTLIDYDNELFTNKQVVTIHCETLDEIIERKGYDKVSYLKMDIEGAEIEAIKGATKFLTTQSPKLLIEALHEVNGEAAFKSIVPPLQSLGYKLLREVDGYRGTIIAKK